MDIMQLFINEIVLQAEQVVRISATCAFPPEKAKRPCIAVRVTELVQLVSKQTGWKLDSKMVVSQLRMLAGPSRCQVGKCWFGYGRANRRCVSTFFLNLELIPTTLLCNIYRGKFSRVVILLKNLVFKVVG